MLDASSLTLAKVLLVGLVILSGITAYSLALTLVNGCAPDLPILLRTLIAAAAATVYEFGPPVMYMASAYFYLLAYALAPLLILLMFRSAARKRLWWLSAAAGGILLSVASASPQHTAFLAFGLLLLAMILARRYGMRRSLPGASLFCAAFVASSLYWLVPTVPLALGGSITPGYLPDWNDTVVFSRNATLLNVLTGYSEWLVWWSPGPFWPHAVLEALVLARIVLPACALLVAAYCWRTWVVRWASIVGCGLVIAAMGAASPLAPAYRFAMFKIPVLSAVGWFIRAPEKFDGYLWLVLVMLSVLGASLVLRRNRSKVAIALIFAVPTVAFASALPKNLAGFADKYVPVTVPDEYYQVADALAGMPGATIWLAPYHDATSGLAANLAYTWAPDRMAPVFIPDSMPGNTFGSYHYTNPFAQEYAYLYSHPENLGRKLAALGITNIVLADDLVGGHNGFLRLQGYLTGDPSIRFVKRYGQRLYLYELAAQSTDRLIVIQGGRASQDDVYGPSLNISQAHLIYAEQQANPAWLTDAGNAGNLPWLLDDRSDLDVAMNRFVAKYTISFTSQSETTDLYAGWGRTLTAQPTYEFFPWHQYLSDLLQVPDAWDFDFGTGVVWSASNGATLQQSRTTPAGTYELLVRGLATQHSSTIGISIGGITRNIPLNASPAQGGLRWFDLGQVELPTSSDLVKIRNGSQHGVVNLVALVPTTEFRDELIRVRKLLGANGVSFVTHDLASQPSNEYIPADTYTLSAQGPVRLINLEDGSVITPNGAVVHVNRPGNFAIAPTDADSTMLALSGADWTRPQIRTVGLLSTGLNGWREVAGYPDSYLQSPPVTIPAGCQSLVAAGSIDVDQVGDFSASVQFLGGDNSPIGLHQLIGGIGGNIVGLNIGGFASVPSGATRVAIELKDRKPGAAIVSNPVVRLLCGSWSSAASGGLSLASARLAQESSSTFVIHPAAYDPQWGLVDHSSGNVISGVPVDGAITLFPQGHVGDIVTYAADESLARGWRLTALATSAVLLICLWIGCNELLRGRIRQLLAARRTQRGRLRFDRNRTTSEPSRGSRCERRVFFKPPGNPSPRGPLDLIGGDLAMLRDRVFGRQMRYNDLAVAAGADHIAILKPITFEKLEPRGIT